MVLPLDLPPLRDRGTDVIQIAEHMIAQFAIMENKAQSFTLMDDAKTMLLAHDWRGNIRELANCMRRAVLLAENDAISRETLQPFLSSPQQKIPQGQMPQAMDRAWLNRGFDAIEREILEIVIAECNGSLTKAAKQLQLSPSTLYRKREQWAENENQPLAPPAAWDKASSQ